MSLSDKPPANARGTAPTPPVKRRRRAEPRQQHLSLLPAADPAPSPRRSVEIRQLWFCIDLPSLPLEALELGNAAAAVFEESGGIRKILLANPAALAEGVRPGLSINASLALVPGLSLAERDPQREQSVLQSLAEWAGTFTSLVSLEAPSRLLLEVAGSLKLFGGLRALRQRIVPELEARGFQAGMAIAPTPLAATWLARAGRRLCIVDARNLVAKLGPLPLGCVDWPEKVKTALQGMGITRIGECLRLPRQGFAKRFGAARLLQLDRALGHLPDPRVHYRSPERFTASIDLQEEQDDCALLLNACRQLLVDLERFLLSRQMAVQHLLISFFHLDAPATRLGLGAVRAGCIADHWCELLAIRFERVALPAAVIAIELRAGRGQCLTAETAALPFGEGAEKTGRLPIAHLAERLSARMGGEAVHGVACVAEHRPQYAWQRQGVFDPQPNVRSCGGPSHRRLRAADVSGTTR